MKGGLNELALFAGGGGGLLGSKLLGWNTRCAVEIDAYARNVLLARQRDGMLEPFPIWDDIRTFNGKPWRGHIDVVTGGFPCQDISSAGKGAGLTGARSGLWFEMLRVIGEVQPSFVFAENSPNLRTCGLGTILEGLTGLGYDVRWGVLGAWHIGAPHKRNRMWIAGVRCVGDTCNVRSEGRLEQQAFLELLDEKWASGLCTPKPGISRIPHGLANRMDRIRTTGNGQVPGVAALAWHILTGGW